MKYGIKFFLLSIVAIVIYFSVPFGNLCDAQKPLNASGYQAILFPLNADNQLKYGLLEKTAAVKKLKFKHKYRRKKDIKLSIGFLNQNGTYQLLSLNTDNRLSYYLTKKFQIKFNLLYEYSENNNTLSALRLLTSEENNYYFFRNFFGLSDISYERNPFAGFNLRTYQILGAGYKFFLSKKITLKFYGGPGFEEENRMNLDYLRGRVVKLYAGLNARLTKRVQLSQSFYTILGGGIGNTYDAATLLEIRLVKHFFLLCSYEIEYNTFVVKPFLPYNNYTFINLGYGF